MKFLQKLFKKNKSDDEKIDARKGQGQERAAELAKGLIIITEQLMPEASGAEKHDVVVTALNELIDIPGLNEAQEQALFGIIIKGAGAAIGLFKKNKKSR